MNKKYYPPALLGFFCIACLLINVQLFSDIGKINAWNAKEICEAYPKGPCTEILLKKRLKGYTKTVTYAATYSGLLGGIWLFYIWTTTGYKRHVAPRLELRRLKTLKEIEELKKEAG